MRIRLVLLVPSAVVEGILNAGRLHVGMPVLPVTHVEVVLTDQLDRHGQVMLVGYIYHCPKLLHHPAIGATSLSCVLRLSCLSLMTDRVLVAPA